MLKIILACAFDKFSYLRLNRFTPWGAIYTAGASNCVQRAYFNRKHLQTPKLYCFVDFLAIFFIYLESIVKKGSNVCIGLGYPGFILK
jgi:hypothetical protein